MLLASEGLETTALEMPAVCSWVIALQVLVWGVPRVPGYTGRARRVSGFEASDFFSCVAFLSIDGIAPKAVVSGVTQVDPFAHLGEASGLILSCWVGVRRASLPDVSSELLQRIKKGGLIVSLPKG